MPDQQASEEESAADSRPERRVSQRRFSKASARLIRETDAMRDGFVVRISDISMTGISIVTDVALEVHEHVKLELSNPVQRFEKQTRGVVRHVSAGDDGTFAVGLELATRLSPLEVSLLKMGIPDASQGDGGDGKIWM